MYPNLKFAAPEISAQPPKCSQWSDLYSVGCVLYYLLALEKNQDPFILSQYDRSNPKAHIAEMTTLQSRLNAKLSGIDQEM
jgi:serine/threonine protein kinase